MTTLGNTLRPLRAAIEASGTPLLTPEQRDAERGGYTDTLNRLHKAQARCAVLEVEIRALADVAAENARLRAQNRALSALVDELVASINEQVERLEGLP